MIVATKFEIIRGIPQGNKGPGIPLSVRPVRCAALLKEKSLFDSVGVLSHRDNVFLFDPLHDWTILSDGFDYRLWVHFAGAENLDVVVVYEEKELPGYFCGECGGRIHPTFQCSC